MKAKDIFYIENEYMFLAIVADEDMATIGAHKPGEIGKGDAAFINLTHNEAVAAARAILKHFNEPVA